jgi:type 1 glutamine amidotransferase
LKVVLLADVKDHGPGEHDYPLWQKQWRKLLEGSPSGATKVRVAAAWRWPTPEQLAGADLLVMFCYPGTPTGRTWQPAQIEQLKSYLARGGGFVLIHSATYTVLDLSQSDGQKLLALTGLAFGKSIRYRHGPLELKIAALNDPICLGLPPTIALSDEPYWPPTGDLGRVRVLATSDEATAPKDDRRPQPVLWTHVCGKGRVLGCVLGHYSRTFDDPYFRILLLRGMAWAAGESPYRFDGLVLQKAD